MFRRADVAERGGSRVHERRCAFRWLASCSPRRRRRARCVRCGKSAALRILSASLPTQRDVTVGVISRPQASIADFYREMGELFGVGLRPHNRCGGAKTLRQRWQGHIQSTLSRPVLLVDEAQEMQPGVLAELRLLASADLDSHILLTVVLAGDGRLVDRLRCDDLLPLPAACECAWQSNVQHHWNSRTASAAALARTL
jgi:hypothetical protein